MATNNSEQPLPDQMDRNVGALTALVVGRWSALGAMAAALLFGFADQRQLVPSGIGTPVPSQVPASAPYLATIHAVAGPVGKVTAPKANGKPYVK